MKRIFYSVLLPLIFLAPDGAGGGGPASGDNSPEAWIARLSKAEKRDRDALVKDMAKALGIKPGEAYKKLKAAGWDPKAGPQAVPSGGPPPAVENPVPEDRDTGPEHLPENSGAPPPEDSSSTPEEQGITDYYVPVKLRHKSPHPHYRRAGLLLAKTAKSFEVTKEQLAVLVNDPWVELVEQ
ncbi:MAG: hypothetical protein LBK13_06695 [Spirochaetales bacterium]|jgi:hypothetical protein|nr:hypothetical protein [Spirochaetales bacterium]